MTVIPDGAEPTGSGRAGRRRSRGPRRAAGGRGPAGRGIGPGKAAVRPCGGSPLSGRAGPREGRRPCGPRRRGPSRGGEERPAGPRRWPPTRRPPVLGAQPARQDVRTSPSSGSSTRGLCGGRIHTTSPVRTATAAGGRRNRCCAAGRPQAVRRAGGRGPARRRSCWQQQQAGPRGRPQGDGPGRARGRRSPRGRGAQRQLDDVDAVAGDEQDGGGVVRPGARIRGGSSRRRRGSSGGQAADPPAVVLLDARVPPGAGAMAQPASRKAVTAALRRACRSDPRQHGGLRRRSGAAPRGSADGAGAAPSPRPCEITHIRMVPETTRWRNLFGEPICQEVNDLSTGACAVLLVRLDRISTSHRSVRTAAARSRPARSVLAGRRLRHARLDQVHHGRVGERGDVAELAVLGDVAQQPAHDLAGAGLGQLRRRSGSGAAWRSARSPWRRGRAASLTSASPSASSSAAAAQDDERDDGLAGRRVGGADHRRLGDRRVRDQRRLDLGGRDAVAGDVHDVVDPAEQPQVAVVVLLRAVAGEVAARRSATSRSPCSARRRPRCRAASTATAR